MPRKATGQVIAPQGGRGWALRFRAYGKRRYVTLGGTEEGWDRTRAEAELRHVLADVERGLWRPSESREVEGPKQAPTFHEFASEWLGSKEPELRPKTITDYKWALELHLLPYFAELRLDEITVQEVDRYKVAKLREGRLGPNAVNKTIVRLAQILDVAVEYGQLDRNAARGQTTSGQGNGAAAELGRGRAAVGPSRRLRPLPPPARGNARRRRLAYRRSVLARLGGREPGRRLPRSARVKDRRGRGARGRPRCRAPRRACDLAGPESEDRTARSRLCDARPRGTPCKTDSEERSGTAQDGSEGCQSAARRRRHRADRERHAALSSTDLREPPRGPARRSRLHRRAARSSRRPVHFPRLSASSEAAREARRRPPCGVRSGA